MSVVDFGNPSTAAAGSAFGNAADDVALAAGQHALVLSQERPRAARHEWGTGARRAGERFGKGTAPSRAGGRADERALGAAWLRVWARRLPVYRDQERPCRPSSSPRGRSPARGPARPLPALR